MTLDTGLAFLIDMGWKSFAVAGLALAAVHLLRRRSAAERACIAHLSLAGLLLLPLTALLGPALEVELLEPAPVFSAPTAAPMAAAEAPTVTPVAPVAEPWLTTEHLLAGAYALPAALLLFVTLLAILRLFSLRGRAQVIVEAGWLSALAHAQRRMGFKHGTALLVSRELPSPVSWGLMRPVILLSEEAVQAPVDAEAIIAHELAHVARADWLSLLVARIACALFWFNPLVWLLARAAHQLREEAADDAVLNAAVPCTDYAQLLVSAARHEGKGLLLAANGVAPGKSSLAIRVRRILDGSAVRRPARSTWAAITGLLVVGVAAPLAAFTPVAPVPAIALAPPPLRPAAPRAAPAPLAPPAAPSPQPAPLPAVAVAAAPAATATATATAPAARAVTPEDLIALRVNGVTPDYARELAEANPRFRNLSSDDLMALRVQGVTAARLREYAAAGYGNLSADDITAFAVHGVTGRYIASLADAGLRNLPPETLLAMRIHGVNADFVRAAQAEGASLDPERLIAHRITGLRPRPRVPHPPSVHGPKLALPPPPPQPPHD